MNDTRRTTLKAYGALFETLSLEELDRLDALTSENFVFRDPFHEVCGREAMKRVLASMFTLFEAPRFAVGDLALGKDHGFLAWHFTSCDNKEGATAFDGTSTVTFDRDARIAVHQDYWDAASVVHARLPLIGPAVRFINRSIARKTG